MQDTENIRRSNKTYGKCRLKSLAASNMTPDIGHNLKDPRLI